MNDDYLWMTGNAFTEMRLIAEGAVELYETDTLPLYRLGMNNGQELAAGALDTVGSALYSLRNKIRDLQELHMKEVLRSTEA